MAIPSSIHVRPTERAFFAGCTGSGKTTLAELLLRPARRLIVMDPKGTLGKWGVPEWSRDTERALRDGKPVRARVPPPPPGDGRGYWDEYFAACYYAGNVLVYNDELYGVMSDPDRQGSPPPAHLSALYTRGRELGIGVWSASQRPVWVPLFTLSESEWFFVFELRLIDDRRRMSEFVGESMLAPVPDEHGFWYWRAGWRDGPIYTSGLKL